MSRITITGGTGFVGTHTAQALLRAGHSVRLVARGRRRVGPRPRGAEVVTGVDITTGDGLPDALRDSDVVINLAAVIVERGRNTFEKVNHQGARNVVRAAVSAQVKHLIHVSAIGADPDPRYPYLLSKWQGEEAVRASAVPHTILRPSIMFGPGDGFFTRLATIVRLNHYSPVVPVTGDGSTTFQPFAVRDLARVMVEAVERGPSNRVHELGGPQHMDLDTIMQVIMDVVIGVRHRLVHVPAGLMLPPAWVMSKLLPNPPITPDQLRMLDKHNTTLLDAVPRDWGFAPRSFPDNAEYLALH